MLERIKSIEEKYHELMTALENVGEDYHRAAELSKEKSELDEIYEKSRQYQELTKQIEESHRIINSDDTELRELAELDLLSLEPQLSQIEVELRGLLVPTDPRDKRNVIMEIRAGAGGDEAALFAAELFRLYCKYAEKRRWKVEVLNQNEIGIGGIKEISFMIKGDGAYSQTKVRIRCPSRATCSLNRIIRKNSYVNNYRSSLG